MGADYGSYAVWDWRRKRKVQSGFVDEKAARAYIDKRRMLYRGWGIVRFTADGIDSILRPRSKARPLPRTHRTTSISPTLRAEVLRRYTGVYGQQSAIARELRVPVGTVGHICRTERLRVQREQRERVAW